MSETQTKDSKMKKVLKTLKEDKFQRIALVWSCPATKQIFIRDTLTGQTKLIQLN